MASQHSVVHSTTQPLASAPVDMKLEVVIIPVSDVDRSKGVLRRARVEARR
jgi:hypothetical protein